LAVRSEHCMDFLVLYNLPLPIVIISSAALLGRDVRSDFLDTFTLFKVFVGVGITAGVAFPLLAEKAQQQTPRGAAYDVATVSFALCAAVAFWVVADMLRQALGSQLTTDAIVRLNRVCRYRAGAAARLGCDCPLAIGTTCALDSRVQAEDTALLVARSAGRRPCDVLFRELDCIGADAVPSDACICSGELKANVSEICGVDAAQPCGFDCFASGPDEELQCLVAPGAQCGDRSPCRDIPPFIYSRAVQSEVERLRHAIVVVCVVAGLFTFFFLTQYCCASKRGRGRPHAAQHVKIMPAPQCSATLQEEGEATGKAARNARKDVRRDLWEKPGGVEK